MGLGGAPQQIGQRGAAHEQEHGREGARLPAVELEADAKPGEVVDLRDQRKLLDKAQLGLVHGAAVVVNEQLGPRAPLERVGAQLGVRAAAARAALGERLVRERHIEILEVFPALRELLERLALDQAPAGAGVAKLRPEDVDVLGNLF